MEYGANDNGRNILLLLTQSSILVNLDLFKEAKYDRKEANMIYLCEKSEWPLSIVIDYSNQYIQWYYQWVGQEPPNNLCQSRDRSEQWPIQGGELSSQLFSTSTSSYSEPSGGRRRSVGQYKVKGVIGGEGRI